MLAAGDVTEVHTAIAGFAATAIALRNFDAETLAASASKVHLVAHSGGARNPVPKLAKMLYAQLVREAGTEGAARLLMSPHLEDEDRAVMHEVVLGVRSHRYPT
jgi:hypothetical protein